MIRLALRTSSVAAGVAVISLLVVACGGDSGGSGPPGPASISVVSGNGQTGTVGSSLSQPLVVLVQDPSGAPVVGAIVSWSPGSGSTGSSTSTTGGDGQASTTWTLGEQIGTQTLIASVGSLSTNFTAQAAAGSAASVQVTPDPLLLEALEASGQMSAQIRDGFGNPVEGSVEWSSGDDGVAVVDQFGIVTAVANGATTVSAASGSISGSADVVVEQAAASVSVSPAEATVTVGNTTALSATVEDANGFEMPDPGVTWSTADPSIATVSPEGVVMGVAEGSTTVTAQAGAVSGTASVDVMAVVIESLSIVSGDGQSGTVGQTLDEPFVVLVEDDGGDPVEGVTVMWTVTAGPGTGESTQSITGPDGQAELLFSLSETAGQETVQAQVENLTVDFTATALPGAVVSVSVDPSESVLESLGASVQLSAFAEDEFGNEVEGAASWSSSDPEVVSVDQAGVATAVAPGVAQITAAVAGVNGTAQVTVDPVPASVSITPEDPQVAPGATLQLQAEVLDALGSVVAGASVTWTSSNEAAATVDQTGLVTGVAVGVSDITASVDGVDGVEVTVNLLVEEAEATIGDVTLTQDGVELDPDNVQGIYDLDVELDLPTGYEGTLEVLFDDIVVASTDVAADPVGAGSNEGGPWPGGRVLQRIRTSTAAITADELAMPVTPNRTYEQLLRLAPKPGVQGDVVEKGLGQITTNNQNVVLIRGNGSDGGFGSQLRLIGPGGTVWNGGDFRAFARVIAYNDIPDFIEMEIYLVYQFLTQFFGTSYFGGGAYLFGNRDAAFGSGGIGNVEGEVMWGNAIGYVVGGGMVEIPIGNGMPLYTDYQDRFPGSFNMDTKAPGEGVELKYDKEANLGLDQDVADKLYEQYGFRIVPEGGGETSFPDNGVGGVTGTYNFASPGSSAWDYPGVTNTEELPETGGEGLRLQLRVGDAFDNFRDIPFQDLSGSWNPVRVDKTPPAKPVFSGNLEWQVNPSLSLRYNWTQEDVDGSQGAQSGPNTMRFAFKGRLFNVDGYSCFHGMQSGDSCLPEDRDQDISQGFNPSFGGLPSGFFAFGIAGYDNAGNRGPIGYQRGVIDYVDPTFSGTLMHDGALGGSSEELSGLTFRDDLEISGFGIAATYKYSGGDLPFQFLMHGETVGDPTDKLLHNEFSLNLTVPWIGSVETTKSTFPFEPTGIIYWNEFLEAGVEDHAGNLTSHREDVSSITMPRTTSFLAGGMDSFGFVGSLPTWVCNPTGGVDCGGLPTSVDLGFEAFTTGNFEVSEVQLWRMKTGAGRDLAAPVGMRTPISISDFGSFKQATATTTFDPALSGVETGSVVLFLMGFDGDGNAVKGPEYTLGVRF